MKHVLQKKIYVKKMNMRVCVTAMFSLFYSVVSLLSEMHALCMRIDKFKITFFFQFPITLSHLAVLQHKVVFV